MTMVRSLLDRSKYLVVLRNQQNKARSRLNKYTLIKSVGVFYNLVVMFVWGLGVRGAFLCWEKLPARFALQIARTRA